MKDRLYPMRDTQYTQGLIDLIEYVNSISPTKEMRMIEIGSYAGESTELFSQHFRHVISIDPFINDYDPNDLTCSYMDLDKVYNVFIERISPLSNVSHIRKTSDDAIENLKDIKGEIDFIYIDGMHTYEQIKKDINNYLPLLPNRGIISGHDYHPVWEGIVNGVNEILGTPDATFSDTSWIKKIN
jgi:predicted O-methyltransferase YrrM